YFSFLHYGQFVTRLATEKEDAVAGIISGQNVWVHSMAATPVPLLQGLAQRAPELSDVNLLQLHLEEVPFLAAPALKGHIRNRCFFAGPDTRALINRGDADYVPICLSEIPKVFRREQTRIDAALIQVSPPDKHGFCSLGVSVEATRAAVEHAEHIVAQINPEMPSTRGDSFIAFKDIDVAYELKRPIFARDPAVPSDVHTAIAKNVASLVRDGDCLQTGIGGIPDAVLQQLGGHKDLGVHTEMFSDGLINLVESGVVNNSRKRVHPGKIVTGFVIGSRALYDFVDENPEVVLLDIEYVNSINTISRNDNVISINSALQVDLTGQVCADSIGSTIYSGVGGQLDFVMGSCLSKQGRSIIALPSTASGGKLSRIVTQLNVGAGVVTSRANVHYVVTEYGVAAMRGRSTRERVAALVEVAHPDYRESLLREARERLHVQV
ncbi:MAG: acetyl-CoA hydrolase/transferase family protein, partial [Granulosicoccaceae bacterium]